VSEVLAKKKRGFGYSVSMSDTGSTADCVGVVLADYDLSSMMEDLKKCQTS